MLSERTADELDIFFFLVSGSRGNSKLYVVADDGVLWYDTPGQAS